MAGRFRGLVGAGIVVLTSGGAACGYERNSDPSGPGYRDTAEVRLSTTSGRALIGGIGSLVHTSSTLHISRR